MQDRVTKCLGVVTQYNPLSIGPGALLSARNCYNRRENIIEDRRGHKLYATMASDPSNLLTYSSRVLVHHGTTLSYDNGSGTFSDYSGSYSAPTGGRVRGVEAFSNLYATTASGVKVFSDITGTAGRLAGAPRALDPSYTLTGSTGFLSDDSQCAYRCTIQRTDASGVVLTGYPSQRLWVTNSVGSARNVALTVYLPSECVAGDVVQFYRTSTQSGVGTDASGDEMGLVYQVELTSSDISAGYITFTDSITNELRGATLYTSPSQEGIQRANERPPLCKDLCLYKDFMIYANTSTKQRLFVSLVGTGSLSSKTITLAGVTYNFGASEIISGAGAPQAKVSATGVAAADIDETARSLVRVINRYASNTNIYAYYLSGPEDLPGQIMLEEKGIGASAFTLQAEDSAISGMFFPAPPVSPATNDKSTSSNTVQKNALFIAKSGQPEHVPVLNYRFAGPANKEILRVVALRDSAIIISEAGLYRLTGDTIETMTVIPIDTTVFCRARESVAVVSNQVFMLSNQGVVAITENGAQVISRDIEPTLTPLLTVASLEDYTCGFAYESERFYFLSSITDVTDTSANKTWVYNVITRTWLPQTFGVSCAIVEPVADKLYFAKPGGEELFIERKTFTAADFADPEVTITITDLGTDTVDFSISGATPAVGDVISQNSSEIPITELSVISGGYRATLESSVPGVWATGSADLYPSVGMEVQWHAWTGGAPDTTKQVSMASILVDETMSDNSATNVVLTFKSNYDPELSEQAVEVPRTGWGDAWGSSPWGGGGDSLGYVTYVPQNKQYCTRLFLGVKHNYARQKLVCAGFALNFSGVSERIGR